MAVGSCYSAPATVPARQIVYKGDIKYSCDSLYSIVVTPTCYLAWNAYIPVNHDVLHLLRPVVWSKRAPRKAYPYSSVLNLHWSVYLLVY